MLRVVLDVNQLVSSLLSTRGLQRQLIDAWRQGAYLLLLRQDALLLPHAEAPDVCRDPSDDLLLGCAAAGDANYLVTGDADREFLALLAA